MSYPLIGAVVGSCVGGPLGCLAGAKVGVFATITCFVLGKFIQNYVYFICFLSHCVFKFPNKFEQNLYIILIIQGTIKKCFN